MREVRLRVREVRIEYRLGSVQVVLVLHPGLFEAVVQAIQSVLQLVSLLAAVVDVLLLKVWSDLSRPSSRPPVASRMSRKPSQ